GVVGELVDHQHVLHVPDELRVGLGGEAPGPHDPRLDVVFLRARRTASRATASTHPRATSWSAKSWRVQQQRPRGGSLQANWISCFSTESVNFTFSGRGGWGRWSRADRKLSVTNRLRTRAMVLGLTWRAARISSSVRRGPPGPSSARSKMRAWANLRAAALPTETRCSSAVRSSTLRVTLNFSIGESPSHGQPK